MIYDDGLGVEKDTHRALQEFKKALTKVRENEIESSLSPKQPLKKFIEDRIRILEASGTTTNITEQKNISANRDQIEYESSTTSQLDNAKKKCENLGFKLKTEAFGECVIKLSR